MSVAGLLKALTVGGGAAMVGSGMPERWSKPVVESVLLPAHGQTSPPSDSDGCGVPNTFNEAGAFDLTVPDCASTATLTLVGGAGGGGGGGGGGFTGVAPDTGAPGGEGAAGEQRSSVVVSVSPGETLTIVVGAGGGGGGAGLGGDDDTGTGGDGGAGGSNDQTAGGGGAGGPAGTGDDGTAGTAGDAGSVTIVFS